MSETALHWILEWSPDGVSAFDPTTQALHTGRTIADLAPRIKGKAIVAVSRRASFVRTARLPDIGKPEMSRILALQVSKILPVEANEVAYDFVPLDNKTSEGRLVLVGAVQARTLKQIIDECSKNGIVIDRVVPVALASMQLARDESLERLAVIGEDSGLYTVDVVDEGALRASRSVPQSSPIDVEVARTFASAGVPIGQSRTFAGSSVSGVQASPLSQLAALSKSALDLNIELPEARAKRDAKAVVQRKNLALLFWVAAFGVGAVIFDVRSEAADKVAKAEKKWNTKLSQARKLKSSTETVAKRLQDQQNVLQTAYEPKQPLGDVVTVLTNLAPTQLWLTGVTAERGKPLTLRGTALNSASVTTYLGALGKQSRMRDVALVFATNGLVETTPVVNFSIKAHVVGNFPLVDEKAAKGGKS